MVSSSDECHSGIREDVIDSGTMILHHLKFANISMGEPSNLEGFLRVCRTSAHHGSFQADGDNLESVAVGILDQLVRRRIESDYSCHPYAKTGFFEYLALGCFRDTFPRLHAATRQAPEPIV